MTLHTTRLNSFSGSAPYQQNRPWADVLLNPQHAPLPTHKCLVDTGADYLQLPASAAKKAGLLLTAATPFSVSTAGGGSVWLQKLSCVDVQIEGILVTVDVLFDPANAAPLIAGRQLLLAAFDLGFDVNAWFRS